MLLADFTASDVAWIALAIALVAGGIGMTYALLRLGQALSQVTRSIERTEGEVLPVINKAGGTIDRVNRELDKVDVMTDSAVDAVRAADTAVRTVTSAIATPVQKLAGLIAGLRYGFSSFLTHHDVNEAMRAAREAAARREADLAEDLAGTGRAR